MLWKRMIAMVPAVVLALGGARGAVAQPEIEALIFQNAGVASSGFHACGELGYTRILTRTENNFLEVIRMQSWDLVIIEMPFDIITQKELVAQLLEDHVAAGGRLLVNFNNLDEWPRLQKLMGLESVRSYGTAKDRVIPGDPVHPSWGILTMSSTSSPWPDAGDELAPSAGSHIASQFTDLTIASVVGDSTRTIVNGYDWDSFFQSTGVAIAKVQIEYIMRCRADFDHSTGVGVLDIFDFIEFQDLFVGQDPRANLNFDKQFDIFDFLMFQNAFVSGCS
jgi:hypothetical protein